MVEGIGSALAGMFFVLIFFALFAVNILLLILKVCGVLLLSWWWIIGFMPAIIFIAIFIAGILSILGR